MERSEAARKIVARPRRERFMGSLCRGWSGKFGEGKAQVVERESLDVCNIYRIHSTFTFVSPPPLRGGDERDRYIDRYRVGDVIR